MDWIFSYNINKFDLHNAIHVLRELDWDCKVNVEVGDNVYLYSSAPEQTIYYRCIVTETNKLFTTIDDSPFGGNPVGTPFKGCSLKLDLEFADPGITYKNLLDHGLKPGVLTKRKITDSRLASFIDDYVTDTNNLIDSNSFVINKVYSDLLKK